MNDALLQDERQTIYVSLISTFGYLSIFLDHVVQEQFDLLRALPYIYELVFGNFKVINPGCTVLFIFLAFI